MFKNWNLLSLLSVIVFITAFILVGPQGDSVFLTEKEITGIILYIISYICAVIALIQIWKSKQKGKLLACLIIISPMLIIFQL